MHVSLTPVLENIVREKVDTGMYNNASEVIREALRMMVSHDKAEQQKLERLRQLVAEGIHSGPPREVNFEAIDSELDAEADSKGFR